MPVSHRTQDARARIWTLRAGVPAAALLLWEGSVRAGMINPFWISSPSLILEETRRLWAEGVLVLHLQETLLEMVLGLAAGCAVGVPAGVLLGAWPRGRRIVEPYLVMLNAFPKIALGPLYLTWFGITLGLKVAMAFSLVVFVMILGTVAGFASVNQAWIDQATVLGASRPQLVRVVVVPALLPWIFTSFRLSVGFALMGAVLGEFIATQRGIGYLIDEGVGMFNTATVFVGLLLLLAIALVANALTEWVGARLRILYVQLRQEQVL